MVRVQFDDQCAVVCRTLAFAQHREMYSIGKDSSVMLHLARKAFYPAPPPFALLHVDTGWKFRDMYAHRTRMVAESGMRLITHTNPDGLAEGVGPFTHGSNYHTDVMKTQALKQALDALMNPLASE